MKYCKLYSWMDLESAEALAAFWITHAWKMFGFWESRTVRVEARDVEGGFNMNSTWHARSIESDV